MEAYNEAMNYMNDLFGNGKDNLISLATCLDNRCFVRTVDAYYHEGCFYAVTYAKSDKMIQIEQNPNVSISGQAIMFTSSAIAENLGWVLKPSNAELRDELRKVFADWYDMANNEEDQNCCILKITLEKGVLNINHWEKLYYVDFLEASAEKKQ